jgi:hypothetical protein
MSTISNIIVSDHIFDQEKNQTELLLLEKRKRSQAYLTLDYYLSLLTYFDFFSYDAFKIVVKAKGLTQCCKTKKITSDFLLYPFLDKNSEIFQILKTVNVKESLILDSFFPPKTNNILSFFIKKTKQLKIGFAYQFLNAVDKNPFIISSYEVHFILEKAAENALLRFKTPIVTPEILFITLMEEKNTKVGKILNKIFKNSLDWHLIRYKLIKRIHNQEMIIRGEIEKSQQYFAYLLKAQLSENEFNRLLDDPELLSLGIFAFRNQIIRIVLKQNLSQYLKHETYESMKITNKRKYSS